MELIFTILVFIFVIGVMVLVHEWGHYFAAKRLGVAVEVFSIGFGPSFFSWKRGETEYRLCILPLGGYVKLLAENVDEGATGDPREFLSRTRWERFLVLFMGPALNILFAFLLWAGVMMIGVEKPRWFTEPARVGYVSPGGMAEAAGVRPGDTILAINDEQIPSWEKLRESVAFYPREPYVLTLMRGEERIEVAVQPSEDPDIGHGVLDVWPALSTEIGEVEADTPAEKAGLKSGDRIVAINGEPTYSFLSVTERVAGFKEGEPPLAFTIERAGERFTREIVPVMDSEFERRRIGIKTVPLEYVTVSYAPWEALYKSGELCVGTTGRLFEVLWKLATGKLSTKAVSGPIEIASISGRVAEQGLVPLLNLMALISLNLGIVNLLPLPVLDGGSITILAIEGIARRDISIKAKEWIMRLGVFLLLLLMTAIIFQDIGKLIGRIG